MIYKGAALVPPERIERSILLIRGQKVMPDRDLVRLYGVETRALKATLFTDIIHKKVWPPQCGCQQAGISECELRNLKPKAPGI